MHYSQRPALLTFASALIVACGLLSSNVVARDAEAGTALEIHARALDSQPQSRIEADQAMDGAVAASVIGAISTQFGERDVAVRLDEVAVQPASIRDRSVSGAGQLRIGDDPSWIPFHFDVLYDTRTASVSYPAITLGDGDGDSGHEIALDSAIARALGQRVDTALDREFAQQPVQLVVGRATTLEAGTRFLLVEALGTADFADEGVVPAQVQALYDRKTGEWLRVDYELGTTSNWSDRGVAVASR